MFLPVLRRYLQIPIIHKLAAGFALGCLLGFLLGPSATVLVPFGDLFIRLLKMIVMPIILTTIVVGAASITPSALGRVGVRIFIYYALTSVCAITIGLALGNVFHLGAGLSLPVSNDFNPDVVPPGLTETLLAIVPTNPFESLSKAEPLPIIFFALIFGVGLSSLKASSSEKLKRAAHVVFDFFEAAAEVMFKITRGILEYAPLGICALMAAVVGEKGAAVFGPFAKLIAVAYAGMAFHIVVVYGTALALFGIHPLRFFRGIKEAMLTAYTSRTSNGTLPVSIACAEEELGIPNRICAFTLPLGATLNMDGTAMYLALEAIFAANVFGVDLTIAQQVTILIVALLASIGTAGVPSVSLVMLIGVLKAVRLPLTIIPLFAGFDAIIDMMRTMTNVTGDLVGTTIVAKMEGALDDRKGMRFRTPALSSVPD